MKKEGAFLGINQHHGDFPTQTRLIEEGHNYTKEEFRENTGERNTQRKPFFSILPFNRNYFASHPRQFPTPKNEVLGRFFDFLFFIAEAQAILRNSADRGQPFILRIAWEDAGHRPEGFGRSPFV